MLYVKIHELRKKKFKVAQIAKELKVSRPTVYKYLEMTFDEAKAYTEQPLGKKKKLDYYKDWILAWIEEYPHLSSDQVHDWLLERYPDLAVRGSTVRTYVKDLRETYQIQKKVIVRQYEAVPEQLMGKQLQVDWGKPNRKRQTIKKLNCNLFPLYSLTPDINIRNGRHVLLPREMPFVVMNMHFSSMVDEQKK